MSGGWPEMCIRDRSIAKLSSFIATQEPEAFATIICVEIDPATGETIWASAGHPAPILLNREGVSVHLRGKPAPPIGSADPQSLRLPIDCLLYTSNFPSTPSG